MTRKNQRYKKPQKLNKLSASQKLAILSDRISSGRDRDGDEDKLGDLVHKYLENGQDNILQQALAEVKTEDSFDDLEFLIIDSSENELVALNDDEYGEASLFAIPLIMLVENRIPDRLNDMDITFLFRKHGVIDEQPTIGLMSDFFQLDDINLSFSKRHRLLNDVLSFVAKVNNPLHSLRKIPNKSTNNGPGVLLRFLIGVTITSGENGVCFAPADEDIDRYELSLESWREAFGAELIKQTGISLVRVGEPEGLNSAIDQGIFMFKEAELLAQANHAVLEAKEKRSRCKAIISLHEDQDSGEIRVSFSDDNNSLLCGFSWDISDGNDADSLFVAIQNIVTEAGVDEVIGVEEIMPLTYCECCGEIDFIIINNEHVNHSGVLH